MAIRPLDPDERLDAAKPSRSQALSGLLSGGLGSTAGYGLALGALWGLGENDATAGEALLWGLLAMPLGALLALGLSIVARANGAVDSPLVYALLIGLGGGLLVGGVDATLAVLGTGFVIGGLAKGVQGVQRERDRDRRRGGEGLL